MGSLTAGSVPDKRRVLSRPDVWLGDRGVGTKVKPTELLAYCVSGQPKRCPLAIALPNAYHPHRVPRSGWQCGHAQQFGGEGWPAPWIST